MLRNNSSAASEFTTCRVLYSQRYLRKAQRNALQRRHLDSRNSPNWLSRLRKTLLISALSLMGWFTLSTPAWARFARIFSILEGEVALKRVGWTSFQPAFPGTALYGDDLLRVTPGTVVILVCPNLSVTDNVQAGDSSVGAACPDTPRRVRPVFGVSDTWTAGAANIPYVITPWSGQVLTPTPSFRWNAVAGAQQYTVTLQKREGSTWSEVWTIISDQTVLCYPENRPALERGEEYALRVTTGAGTTSSQEWVPTEVFSVVGGEEGEAAKAEIAAVNEMEASETLRTLILVEEVYPKFKLFAQGIDDLLSLIESGVETAQIYRLLGDYFIRSGLELPTESSYFKALALATAAENLEEQVKARWGLGTLYNRVGETEQALEQLTAAQQGATALGDANLLASIEKEIGH